MLGTRFTLYEMVGTTSWELSVAPRLASWDAVSSPAQLALARYLDHVQGLVDTRTSPMPSAIQLVIHRNQTGGADVGHDLDNYLYPVVRRLGATRFHLARASKRGIGPSQLLVGLAGVQDGKPAAPAWRHAYAATTGSTDKRPWKEEVHRQVTEAADGPLDVGPVAVEIAFRVGTRRNWINLWKPTIDSLGPIVGEGNRPFAPRDDLIVELGLHLDVDPTLGDAVELGIWWRSLRQ